MRVIAGPKPLAGASGRFARPMEGVRDGGGATGGVNAAAGASAAAGAVSVAATGAPGPRSRRGLRPSRPPSRDLDWARLLIAGWRVPDQSLGSLSAALIRRGVWSGRSAFRSLPST